MLNSFDLVGELGPITDSLEREVAVKRPYQEDSNTPIYDVFKVTHWSRNKSTPFYRVEPKHMVAIKGRIEVIDGKMVVIAEQVNFF